MKNPHDTREVLLDSDVPCHLTACLPIKVVVKIMVSFWIPIIIRHPIFWVPKKGLLGYIYI